MRPCPFCGHSGSLRIRNDPLPSHITLEGMDEAFHVFCTHCWARGPMMTSPGRAEEAWNGDF